MTGFYGFAFIALILAHMIFGWPWLVDQMAGTLEKSAGLLRRHAIAMRAAYTAYAKSWKTETAR